MKCQFIEIYQDIVYDLLDRGDGLQVVESKDKEFLVRGGLEVDISNEEEAMK